jgi:hypothetical protein
MITVNLDGISCTSTSIAFLFYFQNIYSITRGVSGHEDDALSLGGAIFLNPVSIPRRPTNSSNGVPIKMKCDGGLEVFLMWRVGLGDVVWADAVWGRVGHILYAEHTFFIREHAAR